MSTGDEASAAAGAPSVAEKLKAGSFRSPSPDASPGVTEYGAARLSHAEQGSTRASLEEDGRSCGSFFAGPDWRVLWLPWLLFCMVVLPFSIGSPMLLSVLALLFGIHISGVLSYLSVGRGGPWLYFSLLCGFSSFMGLAFGLLLRSEDELHETYGTRAFGYAIIVMLVYLIMVLAISRALPPLGCGLIGSSAGFAERNGWGWNSKSAQAMRFGCDCRTWAEMVMQSGDFPEQVVQDLMKHRCYWSGEPALDYCFHVANEHSFLGVLLAHPANPYEKYERFLVLVIVAILIVFPVAALTAAVHNSVVRGIVILILVTAPRNLLRLYLKRIVIADDEIMQREHQHHPGQSQALPSNSPTSSEALAAYKTKFEGAADTARRPGGRMRPSTAGIWREAAARVRAANAAKWEAIFFTAGILVAGLVVLLSCLYVKAHGRRPMNEILVEATGGLGWAFVLELIFHQCIAYRSPDKCRGLEEKWFLGFFHRWRQERDEYIKRQASS